jgi:AcrR family transcriptional regulator
MLKEQIIATANRLFSNNGIKKVSMCDIAKAAGVSKRTLYESFNNKEALLIRILDAAHSQTFACLNKLDSGTPTSLDIILLFNQELLMNPTYYCDAFYDDLLRYPGAFAALQEKKKFLLDKVMILLERGVQEGVFLPDINYDMIVLLVREYMKMSPPSGIFKKYAHEEVRNTVFSLFIRGICTDDGRRILKQYAVKGYYDTSAQRPFS